MSEPARSAPWCGWQTSCLVGILVVTAWTTCFRFPAVWQWLGIGEGDKPFLDLYVVLAAGERSEAGFDAFQPNPLDPYRRPNVYSEWWLLTGRIGWVRSDTAWLGVCLLVTALVAALALLKPGNRREALSVVAVLLSPAILMAVNRANNDLVIFVLLSVALLALRHRHAVVTLLAIALFAVCAALKYYPIVGAVVVLYARDRRAVLVSAALYGFLLVLLAPGIFRALAAANPFQLKPEWFYAFGAQMLWRNLHLQPVLLWSVFVLVAVGGVILALKLRRDAVAPAVPPSDARREFLVGSVLLIGCFFLGASYVYKLVFALWLLPWLWREKNPAPFPHFALAIRWLLYGVLWFEGLGVLGLNLVLAKFFPGAVSGAIYAILTLEQLLTWLLVAGLLRWICADVFPRARTLLLRGQPPQMVPA